jgi:hypothetical protein
MPFSAIARATAAQPGQHIERDAPAITTSQQAPSGTGSPQWKQLAQAVVPVPIGNRYALDFIFRVDPVRG